MFETIIASVLQGYVARYVNINADQLSVQLLYGRPIIVENLTFNKDTLNNDLQKKLKLPIEIEFLHVGKIECSFQWSSLFFRSSSTALKIKIEHVYIIVKPIQLDEKDDDESNQVIDQETIFQMNKNDLEQVEQQWQKEFEFLGEVKPTSIWGLKRLSLSIIEKVQIQINDVHVRYESYSITNIPYALGLLFDSIQISNETAKDQPSSTDNSNISQKVFQINGLAVYIDDNIENIHQHEQSQILTLMRSFSSQHSYILLPTSSMKIYLVQNHLKSSITNRKQARYELEFILNDINLKCDIKQIQILLDVIRFIQFYNFHRNYVTDPSRPKTKIIGNIKQWWHYITLVIIRTQNYLKSPTNTDAQTSSSSTTRFWFNRKILLYRLHQVIIYKNLYRTYLDNKYLKRLPVLTESKQLQMDEIEHEFDHDCLLKIRRAIFRSRANEHFSSTRIQKKLQQSTPIANNSVDASQSQDTSSSWYVGYAKWCSTKMLDLLKTKSTDVGVSALSTTPLTTSSTTTLNEHDKELQEQLNTFIAHSLEDEDLSQKRRDALLLRLKFLLKSVQLDLLSESNTSIKSVLFKFNLNDVSILTELRPRSRSVLFYLRLDDLNVRDCVREDAFSMIISPKQRQQQQTGNNGSVNQQSSHRAPVFELSYERNPLNIQQQQPLQQLPSKTKSLPRLSFSIAIRSRGLCFVCCPYSLDRFHQFMSSVFQPVTQTPIESIPTTSIIQTAKHHWTQLKDRTTKQLKFAFDQMFSNNTTRKISNSPYKYIKQYRRRSKKKFDIYLDIYAPQMIIPQTSGRAVIVDFGWLTLINDEYKKSCPLKECDMHSSSNNTSVYFTDYFTERSYFFSEPSVSAPPVVLDDDDDLFLTPDSSPLADDDTNEIETSNYPLNIISPNDVSQKKEVITSYDKDFYSSFSLCLCEMQVAYSTFSSNQMEHGVLSPIIEKFGVCFLLQTRIVYSNEPLWPNIKLSGTLPKLVLHLDPERIETLSGALNNWGTFVNNFQVAINSEEIDKRNEKHDDDEQQEQTQSEQFSESARLAIGFRINEISIQLSDEYRALSEFRVQNIDLTLMNHSYSNILSMSVSTLMIVDAVQHYGKDYELLLTSNRSLEINTQTGRLNEMDSRASSPNSIKSMFTLSKQSQTSDEHLIRINIQSTTSKQQQQYLTIDMHVTKLNLVYNPETICALTNFFVRIISLMKDERNYAFSTDTMNYPMLSSVPTESVSNQQQITPLRVQINGEFEELSILFTNVVTITSMNKTNTKLEKVAAVRMRGASLNISLEPYKMIEGEICALQVFNLLRDYTMLTTAKDTNEQSRTIIDLGEQSNNNNNSRTTLHKKEIDGDNDEEDEEDFILPSKAFHFLYTENIKHELLIEMASVCYTHSSKFIYKIQKIISYMTEHCHSSTVIEVGKMKQNVLKQGTLLLNQFVHASSSTTETVLNENEAGLTFNPIISSPFTTDNVERKSPTLNLCLFFATPILVFHPESLTNQIYSNELLVFHLGHIRVENNVELKRQQSQEHQPNYLLKIKHLHLFSINIEQELRSSQNSNLFEIYKNPHKSSPMINDVMIDLNLFINNNETFVNTKLVSSVQIYLSKKQISLFQNILVSLTYNDNINKQNIELMEEQEQEQEENENENDLLPIIHHPELISENEKVKFKSFSIQFELPELVLIFQGDLADINSEPQNVCEAIFGQFNMSIIQNEEYLKSVSLRLESLNVFDHLVNDNECLFSTKNNYSSNRIYQHSQSHLSSSFPTTEFNNTTTNFIHQSSTSVPAYMIINKNQFLNNYSISTPPSSPNMLQQRSRARTVSLSSSLPAFIQLNINIIDKEHEHFDDRYNKFNIIADANFSEVEIKFNIPTWIMLFDIIGLIGTPTPQTPLLSTEIRQDEEISMKKNVILSSPLPLPQNDSMQICINVDAISCLLQDEKVPLMKFSLKRFYCNIKALSTNEANKCLIVEGKLGLVSIRDLTLFGMLYEERFCTSGTNALVFTYKKEEELIIDKNYYFPTRLSLYLRLTSVQYIHTQRFLMDLINFFDRFQQLQDAFNRMRTAAAGQLISCNAGRSTGILVDIEADSPILILPEHSSNPNVIILHLGNIIINNQFLYENESGTLSFIMNNRNKAEILCLLDVINIQFKDTEFYSAERCSLDSSSISSSDFSVKFSDFAFIRNRHSSSMLRENTHLTIQVERNLDNSINHSSPTYSVKANLSSVHILLDIRQYQLVRGILIYNICEQLEQAPRPTMIVEDPSCVSTILTGVVWKELSFRIEMDNVGLELFIPDKFNLSSNRHTLGHCAFIKSSFLFDKYSNSSQDFDLTSESIKLIDTRKYNENVFHDILVAHRSLSTTSTTTVTMQLEIHLRSTKQLEQYTIVLSHVRVLFIIDWLLKIKDFIESFEQKDGNYIQPQQIQQQIINNKSFEIILNFNQSELVLVQNTSNKNSNAVVLSGTIALVYRESNKFKPLDCSLLGVTLFSCQMNNIESTAVSIIEPINFSFDIHTKEENRQNKNTQTDKMIEKTTLELNLPLLSIRLSYYDIKLMLYMFESITKQIDNARTTSTSKINLSTSTENNYLLTFNNDVILPKDDVFITEYCPQTSYPEFRIRSTTGDLSILNERQKISLTPILSDFQTSTSQTFLNIHLMKFSCDHISLCIIDDCLDADIPLLNIHLNKFKLHITSDGLLTRLYQSDFTFNIDYYNRLLSGWEPFLESWTCQLILKYNILSLTSFLIQSNDVLNINYTKTIHQLYDVVKMNWLNEYNNSTKETFRRPKPYEPYCLTNLCGLKIHFQTWLSSEQRFDTIKYLVENNQIKSFTFPSHLIIKTNNNLTTTTTTTSFSDRRLLIQIEGWEVLKPVSIDRVGTFFRRTISTSSTTNTLNKPILIFIDVKMIDSSTRSITIRSPITIKNKLLTKMDIGIKYGPSLFYEFSLDHNELKSLPLQYCLSMRQIYIRPNGFTLNYCSQPIEWTNIYNDTTKRNNDYDELEEEELNINSSHSQQYSHDAPIPAKRRITSSKDRQSFLRMCNLTSNYKEKDGNIYYFCFKSQRSRLMSYNDERLSAYNLTILSPMIIHNLLPCDLTFHVQNQQLQKVCLKPYKSHHEHMINITKSIDIMFSTDLYRMTRPFQLNDVYPVKYNHSRATFYDTINRPLSIDISVIRSITNQIKILISVPYVLINRSGIPLIFKQESCRDEAAGQSHENELARNREPLLFSFSDVEAAYACVMKVGYGVHSTDDGRPLWSQRFSLERGSNYRELHVQSPHGRPDWIYYIGIDVRQGKGRLRKTNYIFLSTRFMISNQCSYDLSVAQRHLVRGMLQSGHYDPDCCLHVLKHSNVAYHWPRSDLDQLLCIRVINNRQYRHVYWSGGFLIDRVDAFHINMRYDDNQCLILRVQVIQRGGTYFVVFMNSDDMPPPIRIDNLSYVPIQFYQTETKDDLSHLRTFIQPKQTVDYAWDEQTLRPNITCSIVGGTKETYNLMQIGHGEHLCYENHICLALQETFDKEENDCDSDSAFDDDRQHQTETYHHNIPTIEMKSGGVIRNRHTSDSTTTNKKSLIKSKTLDISKSLNIRRNDRNLVIDCIQGRLLLAQREENKRSQLWRMTSNGLLVHDGSSSPRDWTRRETTNDIRQSFVLDVEEVSDSYTSVTHMNGFMRLTIRRYDSKRTLTQTWRFLDGYLCMGQTQMCVQVFGELKENSDLVLGPIVFNNKGLLPPEPNMHIRPQRRLKGSGLLSVRTYADGPTRVLEITNVSNVKQPSLAATTTNKEKIVKKNVNPSSNDYLHRVMHIDFKLEAGIGISIVNSIGRESEELVYILLNDIILEYKDEENEYLFLATIGTVIVSNQLLTATTPCLLYTTYVDESTVQPAVRLQANLQKPNANYKNLHILRYLRIGLNSVTVQIDEILLWKMFEFFGMDFSGSSNNGPKSNDQTINMDDGDYDTQRLLSLLTSTQATRIYFNELMLSSINLDLSVYCGASRSLPANLLSIKRHASFPLVKFENAQIHLKSYEQVHIFNTYDFFILSLTNHYIDELKRQAFKILGSVDFLGNPLGLFNDVTDGFASLVDHGSVTGLVKNVAHGVADSTSKFTGTLSYGLGKLASDDEHDEMREAIQSSYRGSSFSHVIGGTVGLAAGFIGGLTSIITQPYKGVVEDGIGGLMKGVAKGIAGTVSKPVVGVLDFANGLAMAIKESSRSKNVILRNRIRLPRCPANILGLLQAYSIYDANGQSLLYQINRGNLNEKYITRLILSAPPTVTSKRKAPKNSNDDNYTERYGSHVHAMITSERVIIYRTDNEHDESSYEIISDYDFGTLLNVVPVEYNRHPYVQFILGSPHYRSLKQHSLAQQQQASSPTSPPDSSQRPFYKCDTQKIATLLSMNVERARGTYEEEKLTYERKSNDDGNEDDDDEDSN